jgi:methylthioribose-1-phosphate isomerase
VNNRVPTIEWVPETPESPLPGKLRLIDQTRLPEEEVFVEIETVEAVFDAIKRLVVRGAPAIGVAAGYGLAAVMQRSACGIGDFVNRAGDVCEYLASSRPTAVNLQWSLDRCRGAMATAADEGADVERLKMVLWESAFAIHEEDAQMCRAIGENGAVLLRPGQGVMTHCNAGALATGGIGTALAPIYVAHESEMNLNVYSNETRPLLQGSRLTAWELNRAGVKVTTICDNMAGQVMREGRIDVVITGADRIAANGDAANKIGTYSVALLARAHDIPLYIAAPYSTIDMSLASGDLIPIEERNADEIGNGFGRRTAPSDIAFYNPAFDVTPHDLIAGFITDRGVIRPPYTEQFKTLFG